MPTTLFTPADSNSGVTLTGTINQPVLVSFNGQLLTQDEYTLTGSRVHGFAPRTWGQQLEIFSFAASSATTTSSSTTSAAGAGVCDCVRMIIDNQIRNATLSTNHEPLTPVDNVKNEWRSRVLRDAVQSEPLIICGTLPTSRLFSGFAIAGHTLSAGATVLLELLDGDCQSGNVVYSSGPIYPTLIKPLGEFVFGVDPWGETEDDGIDPVCSHFFDATVASGFRITINDPLNPAGVWDVSQIFIGDTLQLDNNFSYGFSIRWANAQAFQRTEGGSLITVGNNQQWRELSLPFEFMTDRDREVMARQQRMAPGRALFLSAFPQGTDNEQREFAMSCKFESPEFTKSHYRNWQSSITFMET